MMTFDFFTDEKKRKRKEIERCLIDDDYRESSRKTNEFQQPTGWLILFYSYELAFVLIESILGRC